jgi:hypothetical protein
MDMEGENAKEIGANNENLIIFLIDLATKPGLAAEYEADKTGVLGKYSITDSTYVNAIVNGQVETLYAMIGAGPRIIVRGPGGKSESV